jgi:hypothetical protein
MTCSLGPPGSHMASPQNNKSALPTHHSVPRMRQLTKTPQNTNLYLPTPNTRVHVIRNRLVNWSTVCHLLEMLFIWESWGQMEWHLVNTSKLHASLVAWWQKDLLLHISIWNSCIPHIEFPQPHPNNIQKEIIKCRGCLRRSRNRKNYLSRIVPT